MPKMPALLDDASVVDRILSHSDAKTTDLAGDVWREPVASYRSEERLAAELARVFRRHPTAFCPSATLAAPGAFLAREAAGTPLLAVRGADGAVRVFRNACRHRGTQLVDGSGCTKAFVCPYHGWSYGLDGTLRHVPHAEGFPGLDPATHGLVPVPSFERHGLVFVTQEEPARSEPALDLLPELLPPGTQLRAAVTQELPVNWKIFAEGFLEGYHIRTTHRETFYPIQFDNLNVVEYFGRNTRIAFPYRRVEKQRDVPRAERTAHRNLTYVYHLFPNVMFATFPNQVVLVVIEPVAVDRTRTHTFALSNAGDAEVPGERGPAAGAGRNLVVAGAAEDNAMACAIQRGLASGANDVLEFGLFEGGLQHFHRSLHAALDKA